MADPPSCSVCGRIPSQGAEYCGGCGSPLPRRCTSCGHTNPADNLFCESCGQRLAQAAGASAALTSGGSERAGERRYLTVMFCDLVGSTALSANLDPEDMRRVIQGYQARCLEVITAFDGTVAQYLGDGILAYFGYPAAHEDDAADAVRAALGISPRHGAAGRGARRRTARGPGRTAHRARRRRRDDRPDPRAVRRRRARDRGDAQHRRPAAVAGPAGRGRDRGEHRRAGQGLLRARVARAPRPEGRRAADRGAAGVGGDVGA